MFTSESLFSWKGRLGVIWLAAYFHKKLKKAQVTQTDISSSVDWILQDEFNDFTYRVLAYILLGVVRVYSKKVKYLYDDCNVVLLKINEFAVSERDDMHGETLRAPYFSITRPDRFELDAFDLDILEDVGGGNVRPNEEITLKDGAWKGNGIGPYALDEYHYEEHAAHASSSPRHCTPAEIVPLSHFMDMDVDISISHNLSNLETNMEGRQDNRFSQEECGNLELLCGAKEVHLDPVEPFDKDHQPDREHIKVSEVIQSDCEKCQVIEDCSLSNLDTNMEQLQENRLFQEEIRIFCEAGREHQELVTASGEERMKFLEMTSSKIVMSQVIAEEHPASTTLVVTTQSKFQDAPGASTPEILAIPTPTTKERARISRKRKCLYDTVTVLPNKVLRQCIDDATDLVCKGRKAPYAAFAAWQISNLSQGFSVPLVPYSSAELRSLFSGQAFERPLFGGKEMEIPKSMEIIEIPKKSNVIESSTIDRPSEQLTYAPLTPVPKKLDVIESSTIDRPSEQLTFAPETPVPEKLDVIESSTIDRPSEQLTFTPETPVPEKLDVIESSTIDRPSEQLTFAPETPVSRSTSMRSFGSVKDSRSDIAGLTSSFGIVEKELPWCEDQELDLNPMNKEINLCEGDGQELYGWSRRTRVVARYLHRSFQNQKKGRQEEVVKLLHVLEGRTRKESARLFYEMLVLRSKGYIDVQQDNAYDDIVVRKLPKWEPTFCTDDGL